jgi:transposase
MDIDRDSGQLCRLEVVETGRRRRWTVEAKLRIVLESLAGDRQASATARRHGIANALLFKWRQAYRAGRLGGGSVAGFVPAVIVPEQPGPAISGTGRMEVASANGRRVIVDRDVDVAALLRVIRGLETLP